MKGFTDDDLKRIKETKGAFRGLGELQALIARLEAAEACLLDAWHSSIDDKKLEAWRKSKGLNA